MYRIFALIGALFLSTVALAQPIRVYPPLGGSSGAAGVSSFNTRTGAVTLASGDVTTALGFTPTSLASVEALNLGQFAATTSAQLLGVLSDETGTGAAVFGTSPTLASPTVTGAFTATGLVTNADLVSPSLTIAGHAVSLGGTQAIACADLSNGATGCSTATGTSGATIPLLNGTNTIGAVWTFPSGDLILGTGVQNDFVIFDVNHAASDSGVLISAKANLVSPSFTTPALGVATATSINKVSLTACATGCTLTIPDGLTLNAGAGGTLGSLAFLSSINNANWSGTGLALTNLAAQAANTVDANATSGSATPTAFAMPSCSAATNALIWTTSTGFGCNSAINAGTLGGATFAAPGAIGGTTPAAGSFSGLTITGTVTMASNNMTGIANLVATNASGYQMSNGVSSATNPTYEPNRGDLTSGIGGASGHVALIAASLTTLDITSSGTFFKVITTGTNADTLCMATGGQAQIQASTCTISSARFKNLSHQFMGDALAAIVKIPVWDFTYKAKNADPNGNLPTIGILAEDVARYAPACSIYDPDMHTPKSYKPECAIGMLFRSTQILFADSQAEHNNVEARLERLEARRSNLGDTDDTDETHNSYRIGNREYDHPSPGHYNKTLTPGHYLQ